MEQKIKLVDMDGRGGKWYRVVDNSGTVLGDIMQSMASLNRITGWTYTLSGESEKLSFYRHYHTGQQALTALLNKLSR